MGKHELKAAVGIEPRLFSIQGNRARCEVIRLHVSVPERDISATAFGPAPAEDECLIRSEHVGRHGIRGVRGRQGKVARLDCRRKLVGNGGDESGLLALAGRGHVQGATAHKSGDPVNARCHRSITGGRSRGQRLQGFYLQWDRDRGITGCVGFVFEVVPGGDAIRVRG